MGFNGVYPLLMTNIWKITIEIVNGFEMKMENGFEKGYNTIQPIKYGILSGND